MSERALSFGARAAAYERFRPEYPEELCDLVVSYAGRPLRTALEIGAGTGKATRVFAGRGVLVTATDPDAAMLTELRKHVPRNVQTMRTAFENLPKGKRYSLVYAAAALHWTKPEGRWARVADLLEPGGVFASFGRPVRLADAAVAEAVRAALHADSARLRRPPIHGLGVSPATEIDARGGIRSDHARVARDGRDQRRHRRPPRTPTRRLVQAQSARGG